MREPITLWLANEIPQLMRDRNTLFRRFSRGRNMDIFNAYKEVKNKIKTITRSTKSQFFQSRLINIHDPSTLWRGLRNLNIIRSPSVTSMRIKFSPDELNNYFGFIYRLPDLKLFLTTSLQRSMTPLFTSLVSPPTIYLDTCDSLTSIFVHLTVFLVRQMDKYCPLPFLLHKFSLSNTHRHLSFLTY